MHDNGTMDWEATMTETQQNTQANLRMAENTLDAMRSVIDTQKRQAQSSAIMLAELRELGVNLLRRCSDVAIEDASVTYTNHRGQRRRVSCHHVVVARGATGDNSLAESLRDAGFTVHTVGDCNGVGYIEGALEAAAELAVALD